MELLTIHLCMFSHSQICKKKIFNQYFCLEILHKCVSYESIPVLIKYHCLLGHGIYQHLKTKSEHYDSLEIIEFRYKIYLKQTESTRLYRESAGHHT